ncbi:MAG: phosphotransferase [Polyangiaceae bacterium]|nr:phosphotransferase [Polyangiaceae bacterium]MCW5792468.1 phosphotransferase [Polyangiaceae bacterium]
MVTERIFDLAARAWQASDVQFTEMPGGASTRRFFRVSAGEHSGVAMFVPDATRPDEIAKTSEAGRRWPFLEVRELLEARGVNVPRLLAEDCDHGFILVEDLGDETLARYLERTPDAKAAIYRRAVLDLAAAQRALDPSQQGALPQDSIVRARAFDFDLLKWEVDHFVEWGMDARCLPLSLEDRAAFERAAVYLAREIERWPRAFVHRDYQSRNLMVRHVEKEPQLVWIDFQDALLGPRVYDLVALLNDSYQSFSREFVEQRLAEYSEALGLGEEDRARVVWEFDFVTVQRKLKDAGRFVYIDRVRGNPDYLGFVEPTIDKALSSLARLTEDPELSALERTLRRVTGR